MATTLKRMFEYKKLETEGEVEITKVKGEITSALTIPETMWGHRVVGIADMFITENSILEVVELPQSINKIGNFAFSKCPNLKTINIPDSVEEIGCCAFYECVNLEMRLSIPRGLKRIGDLCFYKCGKVIGDAIFGDGILRIGSQCFKGSGLDGYIYYNKLAISKDAINPFAGLKVLELKRVDDYSEEEVMGYLLSKFVIDRMPKCNHREKRD